MLNDKNKVFPFQKSPWNAYCKNGILLKIPLFSKSNFKTNFSIRHHNSIISVQSIAFECCNNQKVTLLTNLEDSTEILKKSSFSRNLKIEKNEP